MNYGRCRVIFTLVSTRTSLEVQEAQEERFLLGIVGVLGLLNVRAKWEQTLINGIDILLSLSVLPRFHPLREGKCIFYKKLKKN